MITITCDTIEDFMDNVRASDTPPLNKSIWYNVVISPVSEAKSIVSVRITTMIPAGEGILIRTIVECGPDYEDAAGDKAGSDAAIDAVQQLQELMDATESRTQLDTIYGKPHMEVVNHPRLTLLPGEVS